MLLNKTYSLKLVRLEHSLTSVNDICGHLNLQVEQLVTELTNRLKGFNIISTKPLHQK